MPLKAMLNITHSSPRNKRHSLPCRAIDRRKHQCQPGVRKDQKKAKATTSIGVSVGKARQGRVNNLGLASFNNFSRFGNIGAIHSFLISGPHLV